MALCIHSKLLHCLIVHDQSLLALVEAVVHRVWRYFAAVLALTHAQFVYVLLESWIVIVFHNLLYEWVTKKKVKAYLNYSIQGLLERLTVLAEASLQINCVLSGAKCSCHKKRRDLRAFSAFWMAIFVHRIGINPENVSQALCIE